MNYEELLMTINFSGVMALVMWSLFFLGIWVETKKEKGRHFGDFKHTRDNMGILDAAFLGGIAALVCIGSSLQYIFR